MFPTFLQIILDLYRSLYIRVQGLRLLKFRCMRLICCLSVYLLEMVRQHCPVGFLGQMYKRLWTHNRSAGLISRSFPETSWWKFSRIQGFWNNEF